MNSTVKLDALTSLRFFAAAMIVLGHAHGLFGSFGLATTFALGQGVSFFFVLSGFILAYNYPDLASREQISLFFKARFARVWPAHIAAIGLLLLLTNDFNLGGLTQDQAIFTAVANLFLIQSIIPLRDVYLTFNGVAWSISTEAFFYIVFPLLIGSIIRGWKTKLFFLGFLVLLIGWFAVVWDISSDVASPQVNLMGLLYVNPLVRVFEFFIGILACAVFVRLRASDRARQPLWFFTIMELLVVVLVLMSMWLTPRLTAFLGWHGPVADVVNFYLVRSGSFLPFSVLIIFFALGEGRISRALSWAPMILLGEISFSLYLVHMSILKWYENNLAVFSEFPLAAKVIGYWFLVLLVAFLLHKSIENPCRKLIMCFRLDRAKQAFKVLFSGRHVAYIFSMFVLLLGLKQLPAALAAPSCAGNECELIITTSSLPVAGTFGDYVSLLAVRSVIPEQGGRRLEFVFQIVRPLPDGYHFAVHLIDEHSEIITKSDLKMVEATSLNQGDRFLERVDFSEKLLSPSITGLGVAIYNDPSSPLSVEFTRVDYNGRRMLMDLSSVDSGI